MEKTIFLLLLSLTITPSQGFDFTLHSLSNDPQGTFSTRQECGVLQCKDQLPEAPNGTSNHSRRLSSITVYRSRVSGGGNTGHWQQLASLTTQQPTLKRVSDGISVTGQLSEQKAEMTLDLFKTHDCQENQFSCVAVYVDNQGKTSVTKSVVGKGVNSQHDFDLQYTITKNSIVMNDKKSDEQPYSATTLAQVLNLFQSRFDATVMRLDNSLKALENRLEDKIGTMEAAFTNRITILENRLEDKLMNLHIRVSEGFVHKQSSSLNMDNLTNQLNSKFEEMKKSVEDKVADSVDSITKHSCKNTDNFTSQLTTVLSSVKSVEKNLTFFNEDFNKLETALEQRTLSATEQDNKLTDLVSDVSTLSGLTRGLVSNVNTFSNSYAGGALVPVDTFSDPLGVGKKEWKLVFRGTAYNNVQIYPAYMHGTGIPIEVEEGCKQFNRSLPCVNHYRDRLAFDNWVGIDEVLFAIYKDDQIVQSVVFNGRGSTYTSWFAAGRVILSSWDDLTTEPHNFFSIKGHLYPDPGHDRRFHINRDYDKGCGGFRGWLTAKDNVLPGCSAEQTVSMPMFQYAAGKTFSVWTGPNVARADAIGIFLKYE